MAKILVDHIAGVGVIFREADPSQVFIEIKDDGLPIKAFRRGLCPLGGNWIGEAARKDVNTFGTFQREVYEEITLEKAAVSALELKLLGDKPEGNFHQTPRKKMAHPEDTEKLGIFKNSIIAAKRRPFGDFIIDIPKAVIDRADPNNSRDGFNVLVSYFLISLSEEIWALLGELQESFGNLSNESVTIVTSLDEIVRFGIKSAYGHDRPLKEFFLSQGFSGADSIPIIDGIDCQRFGMPMATYQDYLEKFEVRRKP